MSTLVNGGESFLYTVNFPFSEPPGLYWYHPHVYGVSEAVAQGGASGAILVEGIENLQPAVAGLPQRVMIMRDQITAPGVVNTGVPANLDVSLNYVPVSYPALTPGVIETPAGQRQFWRFVNASADTIADVQLNYDGVAQPLQIVALDSVATGSQDGTRRGKLVPVDHLLVPPAGRVEFIMTAPSPFVKTAIFQTLALDKGIGVTALPTRTLAVLKSDRLNPLPVSVAAAPGVAMPTVSGTPGPQLFEGLHAAAVTTKRSLYFSSSFAPGSPAGFFITVAGATPTLFNPNNPPAITTHVGAVEEWTIENHTQELHAFHIHQIHFELLEINGKPVPPDQRQYLDTVQVPYWNGTGPYPSVKVKMDFRGNVAGDLVYHCHILGHEDLGMITIIRILPQP